MRSVEKNYAHSARCIIDEDDIQGSGTVTPTEPATPTLPDDITSQEDCDKLGKNLLFLTASQNGGTAACVTKANVGDTYMNGPEISPSAGVKVVSAGSTCGSQYDYTTKCCWLGNNVNATSTTCDADNNGDSTYSGCKRTMCNWAGGNAACKNWESVSGTKGLWRLPTKEEFSAWQNNFSSILDNQGTKGLQLCARYGGSWN